MKKGFRLFENSRGYMFSYKGGRVFFVGMSECLADK